MGAASGLDDNPGVGESFVTLARRLPMIDAWIKANQEVRGPQAKDPLCVGALYAVADRDDASRDLLPVPRVGKALPRIASPNQICAVWESI